MITKGLRLNASTPQRLNASRLTPRLTDLKTPRLMPSPLKILVEARSSVEAEYQATALVTCEFIWLRHLLHEIRFGKNEQMKLICDKQAALHIASNLVFHERTKHIEVDCHFIREKIASECMTY